MSVPTTTFEVAAIQAELGNLIEARESLLRLLAGRSVPADPEPFNQARAKALALSQQLVARIGSLIVTVNGVSEVDGLALSVDGELVPKEVLGLRLRVNPGPHEIVARAQGRELSQEVDVGEGQVVEVALSFAKAPSSSAADERRAAAPPLSREKRAPPGTARRAPSTSSPTRLSSSQASTSELVYLGAGVGTLGVALGVVGGISAVLHKNSAEAGCMNSVCPSSTWLDLQTARNMATVSNVGFVIGGVGWAFVAGSLLLDRRRPPQQGWRVAPEVIRQGAYVNVTGRF